MCKITKSFWHLQLQNYQQHVCTDVIVAAGLMKERHTQYMILLFRPDQTFSRCKYYQMYKVYEGCCQLLSSCDNETKSPCLISLKGSTWLTSVKNCIQKKCCFFLQGKLGTGRIFEKLTNNASGWNHLQLPAACEFLPRSHQLMALKKLWSSNKSPSSACQFSFWKFVNAHCIVSEGAWPT